MPDIIETMVVEILENYKSGKIDLAKAVKRMRVVINLLN